MSSTEFVASVFDASREYTGPMTVDDAEIDLREFRRNGWDVPDDLTPEEYAAEWNRLSQGQNG